MARVVLLCTGPWTDLPLHELAPRAAEWGAQGLELCCWGDHFEVQRAQSDSEYCQQKLELLSRNDLTAPVVNAQRVGHAVCGPVDARLRPLLPDYVYGDGDPDGVHERAAAEIIATVQVAQKMGIPLTPGCPGIDRDTLSAGLQTFRKSWQPILDACKDAGVRYAAVVQPGQMAFDLYSAEMALEAVEGREDFGFTLDPAALHWQGVDPVEFIRRFPDRILHVHCTDLALRLDGRTGLLGFCAPGDPRRGWDPRSPGHGGIDWESLVRALNDAGYEGALSVDWCDAGMDRDWGAEDACKFVKRLDFPPAPRDADRAFRSG
jgi:sugar phosphate isomerase/epimerase